MVALLWTVVVLCVLVGIAGTVLPILPGAPLVLVGLIGAAALDNFQKVGWVTLAVLALITVSTVAVDLLASWWGVRRVQASRAAVIGAVIGSLVGFFFSIPGIILGPFIGAFAGEWFSGRSMEQARRVGVATWLGMLVATVYKLTAVFMMVGLFILFYCV